MLAFVYLKNKWHTGCPYRHCHAENRSGRTDRKNNSGVKGEARFALLEAAGPVTTVQVVVEFNLTGALAQFSRLGIVREIASAITAQFADNLQRELGNRGGTAGETPDTAALAGATADGTEPVVPVSHEMSIVAISPSSGSMGKSAASLNLPALLWQLLRQRIRRFFQ